MLSEGTGQAYRRSDQSRQEANCSSVPHGKYPLLGTHARPLPSFLHAQLSAYRPGAPASLSLLLKGPDGWHKGPGSSPALGLLESKSEGPLATLGHTLPPAPLVLPAPPAPPASVKILKTPGNLASKPSLGAGGTTPRFPFQGLWDGMSN